jgi:hypothetical protein
VSGLGNIGKYELRRQVGRGAVCRLDACPHESLPRVIETLSALGVEPPAAEAVIAR